MLIMLTLRQASSGGEDSTRIGCDPCRLPALPRHRTLRRVVVGRVSHMEPFCTEVGSWRLRAGGIRDRLLDDLTVWPPAIAGIEG